MVEPGDLEALMPYVAPPNDEILGRAAVYLGRHRNQASRYDLETAHNLIGDVIGNLTMRSLAVPDLLYLQEEDLRSERVAEFVSVGRQPDMTPPYWKRGW